MRRLVPLLACLLLAACYQTGEDAVGAGESRQVDGIADGVYQRPDGSRLTVRWNPAERAYQLGGGGQVRAAPVGGGLWLLDYAARGHVAILARPEGDAIQMLVPRPDAEARLLKAHRLTLKPGPVDQVVGNPADLRAYFADLAAGRNTLQPGERLVRAGS